MSTRRRNADTETNPVAELIEAISELPSKLLLIASAQNEASTAMVGELKKIHTAISEELPTKASQRKLVEEINQSLVTEIQELRNELKRRPTKNSYKELMDELKDIREEVKLLRIASSEGSRKPDDEMLHQYATSIAKSVSESIRTAEDDKRRMEEKKATALRHKKEIQGMWKNKMNTRKQTYFSFYRAKRTAETYEKLLEESPPRMPRKFLPKMIDNEDPEETAIRKNLSIEKFRSEIALLKLRSKRYETKYSECDADMIKYFTGSFDEEISNTLIDEWRKDCKVQEDLSVEIFNKKETWFLNNAFENYRSSTESSSNNDKENTDSYTNQESSNPGPGHLGNDVRKKTTMSATAPPWTDDRNNNKRQDNQKNDVAKNKSSKKTVRMKDVPAKQPGNDFWNKSDNIDMFPDEDDAGKDDVFDLAVIDFKDPQMNIDIPQIPPAKDIVLVPDTQMSPSQSTHDTEESQVRNNEGNHFLSHGRGATSASFHQVGEDAASTLKY